jgi:hypothetical protein
MCVALVASDYLRMNSTVTSGAKKLQSFVLQQAKVACGSTKTYLRHSLSHQVAQTCDQAAACAFLLLRRVSCTWPKTFRNQ